MEVKALLRVTADTPSIIRCRLPPSLRHVRATTTYVLSARDVAALINAVLIPIHCGWIHPPFTSTCILRRMALRALLMRLFLIVALLANGPGIAGALMHMEHVRDFQGDVAGVTAVETSNESPGDCHGVETSSPAAEDHGHPQSTDDIGTAPPLDDCCQAGDCGACRHHCPAAIAASYLADLTIRYRQTAEPFQSVHASAALTNLFRPPIG